MTQERARDVGAMLRTTGNLAREEAPLVLAAILVMAAIDIAGDRIPGLNKVTPFPSLIAMLVFQYQITLNALVRRGYTQRGQRARFWALLGLAIVSDLGILLGFVLLVIPGMYLLVRWAVSVPVLIGERVGVFESLTRSGEELGGRFWPALGFCLVFWAAFVLPAGVSAALMSKATLAHSIVTNLAVNAVLVSYWLGMTALYMTGRPPPNLTEIFA